jgi:putative flippase GtrA
MHIPKFLTVGLLGTLTNLILFYIFVDRWDFSALPVSTIIFLISSIQNYYLNHIWTFSDRTVNQPVGLSSYVKYLFIALAGLGINLFLLWVILFLFTPPLKVMAQAFGISGGTIINFMGSKYWIFRKNE